MSQIALKSVSAADIYRSARLSPRRRRNKPTLDEDQKQELQEAFALFDTDNSGAINVCV